MHPFALTSLAASIAPVFGRFPALYSFYKVSGRLSLEHRPLNLGSKEHTILSSTVTIATQ